MQKCYILTRVKYLILIFMHCKIILLGLLCLSAGAAGIEAYFGLMPSLLFCVCVGGLCALFVIVGLFFGSTLWAEKTKERLITRVFYGVSLSVVVIFTARLMEVFLLCYENIENGLYLLGACFAFVLYALIVAGGVQYLFFTKCTLSR